MPKPSPHSNTLHAILIMPCCLLEDHTLCQSTKRMIVLASAFVVEVSDIEKVLFMTTSGGANIAGLARPRLCNQTAIELSEECWKKFDKLPHIDCLQNDSPLVEIQEVVTMLRRVYTSVTKVDIFCQSAAYRLVQARWEAMTTRTGRWLRMSVNFNCVPPH